MTTRSGKKFGPGVEEREFGLEDGESTAQGSGQGGGVVQSAVKAAQNKLQAASLKQFGTL